MVSGATDILTNGMEEEGRNNKFTDIEEEEIAKVDPVYLSFCRLTAAINLIETTKREQREWWHRIQLPSTQ